jgi:hypothetical protein
LHARTPTNSPPDVKTGRSTPRSLYTLLHFCMSLFCLLRVRLFAMGRVQTWLVLAALAWFITRPGAVSMFPARCSSTRARRDLRCNPNSPLRVLFRPGSLVNHFVLIFFAIAPAHTQRALHGAYSTRGWSG